jgi:hypothetical protein
MLLFKIIISNVIARVFRATAISRSCQEAASFCCEYLCACTEEKIGLKIELQLAFYRFVCLFASIGGVKIVNKDFLKGAMPSLLNACGKTICSLNILVTTNL